MSRRDPNPSLAPVAECIVRVLGEADSSSEQATDTIRARVVDVDLDIDANHDGAITDDDEPFEENPGGYACVRTNSLAPVKLTLEPTGMPGKLTLSANVGDTRIKVWQDAGRTVPVALPKVWNAGAVAPGTLYVEGITPSATVRDVELRLEYDENPQGQSNPLFKCEDRVRLTVIRVEFKENAPCAGFDPTLNPPWLMVPLPVGGNNKANAEITPVAAADNVNFESAAVAKATVAPATASGSPEIVTVTSVAEGETEVHAKVGSGICAKLGVDVCNKITKTIKIHAITEDNDDVQAIPVGKGKPNQVAITAGANTTLDSTPGGDDQVAGITITTGADGICNTTVAGDDVQAIAVGNGKANENCVTAGVNAFRDTKTSGDDTVVGDDITTGPDGICDTVANATDIASTRAPSAADLQNYLNNTTWGKQANVHFTVTNASMQVNYDLDRSGTLAHPSRGSAPNPAEGEAISTAAKDGSVDYNIYYVYDRDYSIGTTIPSRGETWTAANGANSAVNHTAHEVGHLLGILYESSNIEDVMLSYGSSANPCRVIKRDWDTVNPN